MSLLICRMYETLDGWTLKIVHFLCTQIVVASPPPTHLACPPPSFPMIPWAYAENLCHFGHRCWCEYRHFVFSNFLHPNCVISKETCYTKTNGEKLHKSLPYSCLHHQHLSNMGKEWTMIEQGEVFEHGPSLRIPIVTLHSMKNACNTMDTTGNTN